MKIGRQRGKTLARAAALGVAVATLCCCHGPAPVARPAIGARPITVVPPAPREEDVPEEAPIELDHPEEIRALLAETDQPIRLRVFARPLEGDETTDALIRAGREILRLAPGPTRFDLDDPFASPEAAEEARILGVEPLGTMPGDRRRRDPLPPDRQYRALIVAVGLELLVVPQVTEDRGPMEFQIAEAISRLMHGPRLVGLVTSEERFERLGKLRRVLDRLDVRRVSLDRPIDEEFSAVLVVGPGERLRRPEVDRLRAFLRSGRSVGLLLDEMKVELAQKRYSVRRARSGLERLLDDWGLSIERGLIFDNECGRVSVPARVGRMFLPYPPIPNVSVVKNQGTPDASTLRLPFPSSLEVEATEGVKIQPILRTSQRSWRVTGGYDLSPFQDWDPSKRGGPFVVGALAEKGGERPSRLAVVANSRFVDDQYLGVSDNALFVRQLVEWLGGHRALTRLIEAARSGED